jgi:hypothetical protein
MTRSAFGMLETTIATALTSLLLVVALNTAASVNLTLTRRGYASKATQFASLLLTEAAEKCFQDPTQTTTSLGLESGESTTSRAGWDDVDDFNGLNLSALVDRSGTALPDSSGWQATMSVVYAVVASPQTTSGAATTLKRVQLNFTDPSGRVHSFYALRSQRGVSMIAADAGSNIQSSADVRFTLSGRTWATSARLNNQQVTNSNSTGTLP